jgi:hypothetical protein
LRPDGKIANCCGVSVTAVSSRKTKNKEKSEGCRLSTRGTNRTRKSERNVISDELELHLVKKVTDFYFETFLILRYRKSFLLTL